MGIHYGDRVFRHRLDNHYTGIWMPEETPLRFSRGMHEIVLGKKYEMTTYVNDDNGTHVYHPPDKYRVAIEQWCYARNENKTQQDNNYVQITSRHGKYFYYEDDLECRQLELDLDMPKFVMPSRRVPYSKSPFFGAAEIIIEYMEERGIL